MGTPFDVRRLHQRVRKFTVAYTAEGGVRVCLRAAQTDTYYASKAPQMHVGILGCPVYELFSIMSSPENVLLYEKITYAKSKRIIFEKVNCVKKGSPKKFSTALFLKWTRN